MKKIKKSTIAVLVAGALLGGGVTYAGSTIFGNLDQIRDNFDFVFNVAKTNEQKAKELQYEINQNVSDKTQLEQQIAQLKNEIETIKNNHAAEITNKNAVIQSKQDEITQKQAEVDAKQTTINDLTNQLSASQSQLSQAETKVVELLNHTTSKVNELTE